MYSYIYDSKTGGILLNSTPTGFSKEPRPVYASELDILGFDKYWKYDKQSDIPYMWAESNRYWYRGVCVAQLRGGNVYTAPEIVIPFDEKGNLVSPEPNNYKLRPIDIATMVYDNREMLDIIERVTVKKILAIYTKYKYKNKLDIFQVAFSGGKDSCVLLDLVKKALPKGSFVVVFGDTEMEFPDTYDVVEQTRRSCEEEGILFYTSKSHISPYKSWELFGPPSRVLRWCCSVHKSTPQTLKLREVTGKNNYTGLSFVGVRSEESTARSEYEYENYGRKQRGQYSHNSILEWTSAEVWLYIYANSIIINEAYKKGSARVGCLCCPMGGGRARFIEFENYKTEVNAYFDKIRSSNGRKNIDVEDYINISGWSARKNGRDLANNPQHCIERVEQGYLTIEVQNPTSDWHEWIKTLDISKDKYSVTKTNNGYIAKLPERLMKDNPLLGKLFRQVFRKSAHCVGCRVCEANCPNKSISFDRNKILIKGCVQCKECHSIDSGCLVFHSLRHPQGEGQKMKSINTLSNHAPKTDWFVSFFEKRENFFAEHNLGPVQIDTFKRFLRDAGLIDKSKLTPFADIVSSLGWDTDTSQGLIFINLVFENPQIEWYVKSFDIGRTYQRKVVEQMLIEHDVKSGGMQSIISAFKRLTETPLGTKLNFGYVTDNKDMVRTVCNVSDQRVVLYGLFKFAEKCNDYKEFTLNTLLNDSIERDGISPTRIFGLDRQAMIPILLGLSAKYPDFINATFTNDLDKISLSADKTSADVLNLF